MCVACSMKKTHSERPKLSTDTAEKMETSLQKSKGQCAPANTNLETTKKRSRNGNDTAQRLLSWHHTPDTWHSSCDAVRGLYFLSRYEKPVWSLSRGQVRRNSKIMKIWSSWSSSHHSLPFWRMYDTAETPRSICSRNLLISISAKKNDSKCIALSYGGCKNPTESKFSERFTCLQEKKFPVADEMWGTTSHFFSVSSVVNKNSDNCDAKTPTDPPYRSYSLNK